MNIYSARYMVEASASLRDKVFVKPVNETYLFSTMNALREMNSIINKETEKLYMHISEAESKEDENKLFAEYFYQFKSIFQDFSNRIQQMKSRMVISIENKVETWEDLYKNDEYIAAFDKQFNYAGYNFFHMDEHNYPRLNLQKLYQKEFDYIGQLMQDSSVNTSPSVKLKIIATVFNNFGACSRDKNWIKDLVKDMVDIDDKEITRSYSECIYNSLRDKYDINVDKGMLYTCKENLSDYEDIIDAASKLCDNLLYELDKVAENIASFLFRNKDNKLKIKTDTDGIIDRDYRLDTYSMNQLDLFLKSKINQIKKVLNVYAIAVGIKFDTAVDYIDQNIEILKMAKEFDSPEDENTEESPEDVSDDGEQDIDELEDDEETDDLDSDDDDTEDDSSDDEETDDDSEESDENSDDEDSEEQEPAPEFDMDANDFEEGYLFESELFELEMMYEMNIMHDSVRSALLLEEEQPEQQPASSTSNVEKIADKANIWQKIITKLIALWRRFKEVINTQAKLKVDYLKKNEKYINTTIKGVEGTITLAFTPEINKLEALKIEDLNYNAMEQHLASEEAFCTQYYAEYYTNRGELSFSDYMKEKILKGERKINPTESKYIKEAFDFCENYMSKVDAIRKQTDVIEKAQRVAKDASKVQESYTDNDFSLYFTEMEDNTTTTEGEEGKAKASAGKDGKLAVYFKVSSQVLAAKMTMYQKLFNEYFKFCHWYIKRAGGPAFMAPKGSDKGNKDESKSSNPGDVQKFDD